MFMLKVDERCNSIFSVEVRRLFIRQYCDSLVSKINLVLDYLCGFVSDP